MKTLTLLITLTCTIISNVCFAEDLSTDPFIKQELNQSNWEPNGKHFPQSFFARGGVVARSSTVAVNKASSVTIGNITIETGNVSGAHNYTVDLSAHHPISVHSPFDVTNQSSGEFSNETENTLTKINISWDGLMNHPSDGYDGPPAGAGARDLFIFDISGDISGHYYTPPSNKQKTERATIDLRYRKLGEIFGKDYHHSYVVITNEYGDKYSFSGDTEKNANWLFGDHGSLRVSTNQYVKRVYDYQINPTASKQYAMKNGFLSTFASLHDFSGKVNAASIKYKPRSTNSNSFAHQSISEIGYSRPSAVVWSPGSAASLSVN